MALPFGGGRLPLTPTNPHSVSGPHTLPSTSLTMLPRDLGVDGAPLPVLRVDPLVGFVDLDHMAIAVDHQVESVDHRRLLLLENTLLLQPPDLLRRVAPERPEHLLGVLAEQGRR